MTSYRFTQTLLAVLFLTCMATQNSFAFKPEANVGYASKLFNRFEQQCERKINTFLQDTYCALSSFSFNSVAVNGLDYNCGCTNAGCNGIAQDAVYSSSVKAGTSLTYSHTTGTDANLLIVTATINNDKTATVARYNGVNLTLMKQGTFDGRTLYVYVMPNPPSGAHDVYIYNGGSGQSDITVGSVTYKCVDIDNIFSGGLIEEHGQLPGVQVIGNKIECQGNNYTLDFLVTDDDNVPVGSGQTQVVNEDNPSNQEYLSTSFIPSNANPADIGWTLTNSEYVYIHGCLRSCVKYEKCSNGIDDDGDGLVDSADPDCPSSCVLLTNTDLNTNLSGWTVTGTVALTADAYNGAKAVELTSSWATMSQTKSGITAGKVYTLSFNGKQEGTPDWIPVKLEFLNASGTVLSETYLQPYSTCYNLYRQSATAPPGATQIRVSIEKSGSGKLKLDEFCLQESNPAVGECTLIENSGFENSWIGWETWNASLTNVSDVKSGSNAVMLGEAEGSLYRRLGITPGETYELSAWSKVGTGTNYAEIYLIWKDASGNNISDAVQPINLSSSTYNYYSLKGKAPSNAVYVEVGAYKSTGGIQFVDDFCIKKIPALGGTSFDLSCGCSDNLVGNGGYEATTLTSFPYTLDGKPAAAIPNNNSTSIYPWSTGISSPFIYLVNDPTNTVNNPEGSRYVFLPGSGDCWTSNTDFSNNLLMEDGQQYTFCFYAASRSLTMDGNGYPTGAVPTQNSGLIALEFQFVSGFKAVNSWAVPASESATNLSWTKYEYTFTYNILDPVSNFTFTNSRWNVGMYLDGISLSKVNCPAAVTCNSGGIAYDRWGSISGTSVDNLITHPDYPNKYNETGFFTSFQGPKDYNNDYGTRVYGYLMPPTTGNYTFNVTSGDASKLYLGTNSNPSTKALIAEVTGFTNQTEYTKYAAQTSTTKALTAGQPYYIELIQKAGSVNSDHFQVYWKKPGDTNWSIIPGSVLRPICSTEVCDNGRDDDFDTFVDCADSDCSSSLTATANVIPEGCGVANGSITMTATGTNTPYSYRWSDMVESAQWTFEDNLNDITGNGKHSNGVTGYPIYLSDAKQGNKSLYFNGSTMVQYSVPSGFMTLAASNLTVAMWIKPDNLTGTKILFEEGGTNANAGIGFAMRLNGSTLEGRVKKSGGTSATYIFNAGTKTIPNDGNWHHVAMVFAAGKVRLYLDGVAGTETTANFTSIAAHSNAGGIGGAVGGSVYSTSANYYVGRMDDVRYYYNKVLTANQIVDLATNNGARSNLSAGNYNVTISSASGCSISQAVTVSSGGNFTDGGTISGTESGCGTSFDPQIIGTTSAPSPGSGTTEYKWQSSSDQLTWTDIAGTNSATYDPSTIAATTYYRRGARLLPCTGWVFSNTATKFTTANFSTAGVIASDEAFCGGYDPAVIVGTPPTSGTDITWKVDPPVSGSLNGATYTVTNLNGEPYYLTVTGANVTKVTVKGGTPTATYTTPPFTNLTAPINPNNGKPYGISHFDIWVSGAVNGTTEYKWQRSVNAGTTWEDIASSNTATYDPTFITQTTTFRRGARVAECDNSVMANPYEVEFCTYNINLLVGETFNLRDYLHYKDGNYASKPIDWSKVFFTYTAVGANDPTNPADWNLTKFNSGEAVTLLPTDATNPGNSGTGSYRIYVYRQGQSTFDDHAEIRVTTSGTSDLLAARCTGIADSWKMTNNVTKTVELGVTDAGIIVGDEDNCGSFDPGIISSVTTPTGGVGGTILYQWQLSTDGGTTWNDVAGATLATLDPITITSTTHYRRGARRSTCTGFLYSNSVVKMVVSNFTNPGLLSGNESNCAAFNPSLITSVSLPSGGVDGYTAYKWQKSFDNGATWEDIVGATGPEFDPVVTVTATTLYRRQTRRTPCAAWINSNTIIKEVKDVPTANIAFGPTTTNGYICEATNYNFQAADAGTGVTYAWNFGSYATPATATGVGPFTVSFNVPNSVAFTTVPVQLTVTRNGCSNTFTSNYNVRPPFTISSVVPTNPSTCSNNNGKITVNASSPSGSTLEGSINGTTWIPQPIVFNNLGPGNYNIWVRYSGDECQVWWGDQILEEAVNPNPYFSYWNTNTNCINQIFTVQGAAATGSTVTWEFGPGASPATASGLGPHSVVYSTGGVKTMRISATKNGCTAYEERNFTVIENYSNAGTIGNDQSLCANGVPTAMLSLVPPSGGYGGSTSYQWEYRQELGTVWSAWTAISGATGSSYQPGSISVNTEYRRRVRRSSCGSWIYSNVVAKNVTQLPGATADYFDNACPGFTLVGYVGTNDTNLDDPIYSIVSQPFNGYLDMDVDGEFYYLPNTTFCGGDQFEYQVCNNTTGCCATATAYIDMSDSEAPALNNIPDDLEVSCDDEIPLPPVVDAFENCGNVWLAFDQTATQGADSCSIYSYLLTRVWSATDYCGNSEIDQQVITVSDETAPDIFRIYTLPNGKRMIAGVMENVSQRWKTIRFPIQFDTPPVVIAQVSTNSDASAVTTRLRNVATTQFQMRLQEEENNDGAHGRESVAWVAIEKGIVDGEVPLEVNSKLISSTPANTVFSRAYPSPSFVGQIQSFNEANPATVRMNSLGTGGAVVFCQEETSMDMEMNHGFETVGYLTFSGSGNLKNDKDEIIGEAKKLTIDHNLQTVQLTHKYQNPVVVFGGLLTTTDPSPATIRVVNLTPSSFQVFVDEWDYLDGNHGPQEVSYIVVEGSIPFDQVVECSAVPEMPTLGVEVAAIDGCDLTTPLVISDSDWRFDCETDTTLVRTFYVRDECGNFSQYSQTFILRDTTPPTFTVPADITIACDENKDDLSLTGDVTDENDNCDVTLDATYEDNLSYQLGCRGYVLRIWTLEDHCGNRVTQTQRINYISSSDSDGDGVADDDDLDNDNDGIPNLIETNTDTDEDGIVNDVDLDSDNDGITDLIETGNHDSDGNGRVDNSIQLGWDNDGDGYASGYDCNDYNPNYVASSVCNTVPSDADQDGILNFLDLDSDNDGITDIIEAGGADSNGDGHIDYPTPGDPTSMQDSDSDGYATVYDPDEDSVPGNDAPEAALIVYNGDDYTSGNPTYNPDYDNDEVPNFLDTDSDNDGIPDLIEMGGVDENGDGHIDLGTEFQDENDNGLHDNYEVQPIVTTEPDGTREDGRPEDTDNNVTVFVKGDIDSDGLPNSTDYEADGDGISDLAELRRQSLDTNNDGVLDVILDNNHNGFHDVFETTGLITTDPDGSNNDGLPTDDSDSDNSVYNTVVPDGTFGETNGQPDVDDDGDGLLNTLDLDSDGDGVRDNYEDRNTNGLVDAGEMDFLDTDTDEDDILDGIEDTNQNGYKDEDETSPLLVDTDSDLLTDSEEDSNFDGIVNGTESNPRDACDPYLSTNCVGVAIQVKALLQGPTINGGSPDLMKDKLRQNDLLPTSEPYKNFEKYRLANDGGYEICDPTLFDIEGKDAVVDWILVELRHGNRQDSIVATRSCLLQRDGDVVGPDGDSILHFNLVRSSNYYVAVRHRNHLGVITESPSLLSPTSQLIDFRSPNLGVKGSGTRVMLSNGQMALWGGDFNANRQTVFQGPNNDVLQLFFNVMTDADNTSNLANFILEGYLTTDFDLDGKSIFQGPTNERSSMLVHTILTNGNNVNNFANYVVSDKLPETNIPIAAPKCGDDKTVSACDFDGDGTINDLDNDDDNDGVWDFEDINPYNVYSDSDADGISDYVETKGDGRYNPAEDTNPLVQDSDSDGLKDGQEDANKNGSMEANESNPLDRCSPNAKSPLCDFDNDMIINAFDLDDDNDGVADVSDVEDFNPSSDSDLDGISDLQETGDDGIYNAGLDSNPLNACDPTPTVGGGCTPVDLDGDGYFANYPPSHQLFDQNDGNPCIPSSSVQACPCEDTDGDGKIVICSNPGTQEQKTRSISLWLWPLYFAQGSACGPCQQ